MGVEIQWMVLIAMMFLVPLVTAFADHAASRSQRLETRTRAAWEDLARQSSGRLLEGPSEGLSVVIVDQGVSLTLRVDREEREQQLTLPGENSDQHTRVDARFALGAGPAFVVAAKGTYTSVSGIDAWRPMTKASMGTPAFKAAFRTQSADLEGTEAAWTARAQALMTEWLPTGSVTSDGKLLVVRARGVVDDTQLLRAMLDLATELALVGVREFGALADPPLVTFAARASESSIEAQLLIVDTGRGSATASLSWAHRGPGVRLVLPAPQRGSLFSARVVDGGLELPHGTLVEGLGSLLAQLEGAEVTRTASDVAVEWKGIPSPTSLRAGVALLSTLASGQGESPFR